MKTSISAVLITFALVCFGFSPMAKALLPAPSPDGSYPGANTAEGINALHDINTAVGINNTAVGANALASDTTGYSNVAVGSGALASNTTGKFNMAIGAEALQQNNASFNLAIGFRALFMNTRGSYLTGIGATALRNNTTGYYNTAIGARALQSNTTGYENTATGVDALFSNTRGRLNTADGIFALYSNTTGDSNTAIGKNALWSNSTGYENTANGVDVLVFNTTGARNTANGFNALLSNTIGSDNTALGASAGTYVTTARDVICIGANVGGENVSGTTWIGGIYGVTTHSGTTTPVVVSDTGQLGTVASSKRFKKDISTMEKASEAILSLRPVTFHYKADTKDTPQFGLIAEEVAKVNPALVLADKEGKPYTVRYDQVNAMLLNEFLKEHRKNEEQQKQIEVLMAQLKEQGAQIRKVSAQIAGNTQPPQVVSNIQ
jgi:hypothetical protein